MRVVRGPRHNRHRPAVDPLFLSAARAYGPRVVGIVLSGALDDGTKGLATIKARGGVAVVQDPQTAAVRGMPQSALGQVDVDHRVAPEALADLIVRLGGERVAFPRVRCREKSRCPPGNHSATVPAGAAAVRHRNHARDVSEADEPQPGDRAALSQRVGSGRYAEPPLQPDPLAAGRSLRALSARSGQAAQCRSLGRLVSRLARPSGICPRAQRKGDEAMTKGPELEPWDKDKCSQKKPLAKSCHAGQSRRARVCWRGRF